MKRKFRIKNTIASIGSHWWAEKHSGRRQRKESMNWN
jgi:hypothetical protein